MPVSQSGFLAAVLDPALPPPDGLISHARHPTRRFSVYRNNVIVGLTEALDSAFPVLRKLVGDEFFAAMAGVYVRRFPPTSPVLSRFGYEMPGFLEEFPPVAHLPYLVDIARLELLIRESYHEADSVAVDNNAVLTIPPGELPSCRFALAPSLRLLRSRYPACSIWHSNALDGPRPGTEAEDIMVVRPEFDPRPVVLPNGGFELVARLAEGAALGDACEHASADDRFRLDAVMPILVSGGAVTGVIRPESEGNCNPEEAQTHPPNQPSGQ